MSGILETLMEQFKNIGMIFRLAQYDIKARSAHQYLGQLWEWLDPFFQVITYFIVFGIGMRTSSPEPYQNMPYLAWMMLGMTAWYFANNAYSDTIQSINSQVRLVSKMKFPVSIFVNIRIVQRFISLMSLGIVTAAVLIYYRVPLTLNWIQMFYYFAASLIFVFSLGLLTATLTVIIPDIDPLARTLMRMIFWVSGVLWELAPGGGIASRLIKLVEQLNPFYYIVDGFREAVIGKAWFWENYNVTLIFWIETLIIFLLAVHVHLKFRQQLVDFI